MKANIIWGKEEYLYKADCTLQNVTINGQTYYVLNTGYGYDNVFQSFIDVSNFLDCKPFNRLATIEDSKTSEFLEDFSELLLKYGN